MNVIKKSGNANAFILPVVLILAAAFLATSLSTNGIGGGISGAFVDNNGYYAAIERYNQDYDAALEKMYPGDYYGTQEKITEETSKQSYGLNDMFELKDSLQMTDCGWSSAKGVSKAYCPTKSSFVVNGVCNNGELGSVLFGGSTVGVRTVQQGWDCGSNSLRIDIFCCN